MAVTYINCHCQRNRRAVCWIHSIRSLKSFMLSTKQQCWEWRPPLQKGKSTHYDFSRRIPSRQMDKGHLTERKAYCRHSGKSLIRMQIMESELRPCKHVPDVYYVCLLHLFLSLQSMCIIFLSSYSYTT